MTPRPLRPPRHPGRIVEHAPHHRVRRAQQRTLGPQPRDGYGTGGTRRAPRQLPFQRRQQPGRETGQCSPSTTVSGSSRLTAPVSAMPSAVPASRRARRTSVSPWAARSASRPTRSSPSSRPAARRTASSPAYCSRQPRPPHGHSGPSGRTGTCPSSPAKPRVPRSSRPSTSTAAPMPISADTCRKSRGVASPSQSSARPPKLASLSTVRGSSPGSSAPRSVSCQSRLGARTTVRASRATRPGTATARPAGHSPSRSASAMT